jgi:hypothetical protein
VLDLGESLSPAVAAAVPVVVERVLASVTSEGETGAIGHSALDALPHRGSQWQLKEDS